MAGVFSNNRLWKFNTFGESGYDLNELPDFYVIYVENGINTPNGYTTGCCMSLGYGVYFSIQFYTASQNIWCRAKHSQAWGEWVKMA